MVKGRIIFGGVASAITAQIIFDRWRRHTLHQTFMSQAQTIGNEPVHFEHSQSYEPRKIHVIMEGGRNSINMQKKVFKKYAVPLLTAAGCDYDYHELLINPIKKETVENETNESLQNVEILSEPRKEFLKSIQDQCDYARTKGYIYTEDQVKALTFKKRLSDGIVVANRSLLEPIAEAIKEVSQAHPQISEPQKEETTSIYRKNIETGKYELRAIWPPPPKSTTSLSTIWSWIRGSTDVKRVEQNMEEPPFIRLGYIPCDREGGIKGFLRSTFWSSSIERDIGSRTLDIILQNPVKIVKMPDGSEIAFLSEDLVV